MNSNLHQFLPAEAAHEGYSIRVVLQLILSWWWILLLGTAAGVGVALLANTVATPLYVAESTIVVQGGQRPGSGSVSDLQASRDLAATLTFLVTRRDVLESVIDELGLAEGPEAFKTRISVSAQRSIITINSEHFDAVVAADIANTLAEIFIEDFQQRQFVQIAQFQVSLSQIGSLDSPTIQATQAATLAAQAATLTALGILDLALVPGAPSKPNTTLNLILGAIAGLVVAGVLASLREYTDDRIRMRVDDSHIELTSRSSIPILGRVPKARPKDFIGTFPIIGRAIEQVKQPKEPYNFIAANIEFALIDKPRKVIAISSAVPGEGKTTTAVNLGITFAQRGKTVLLVEADLRRPGIAVVLELSRSPGLTDVVLGTFSLERTVNETYVPGLSVLTTGALPADPASVLASSSFSELFIEICKSATVVIIDTAPILTVADSLILHSLVDGIVLVANEESTGTNLINKTVAMLGRTSTPILGVVLNKSSLPKGSYYEYGGYTEDRRSSTKRSQVKTFLTGLVRR